MRDPLDARDVARPTIEHECRNPGCNNNLAYFYSRQIRSVDEGQTVYYECTECGVTTTEDTWAFSYNKHDDFEIILINSLITNSSYISLLFQCLSLFFIYAIACYRTFFWVRMVKFSWTAFGLPGRVTTIALLPSCSITPITLRERQAIGVILSASACMNWLRESACFVMSSLTASGVRSQGVNPVPPDVRIRSTSFCEAAALTAALIFSSSSGTILNI